MSEKHTLYKLIILYMLHKVDFPLTTSQISEFVLDQGYTTYFKLQEALTEMVRDELLIIESTHNRTLYHLTAEGEEIITIFEEQFSPEIKQDIDGYLKEKHYDLKEESGAKSNYRLNADGEYIVRCQIVENGINLIDIKIVVPTETEAKAISINWIKKNQQIYTLLLAKLL